MAGETAPSEDRPGRRTGIPGWLIVFVLAFGLIGPAYRLFAAWMTLYAYPEVATIYDDRWGVVQALVWAVAATGVVLSWALCWRLAKVRTRRTVRLAVAGLWLLVLGLPLLQLVGTSLLTRGSFSQMGTVNDFPALETIVFCAAWTAYLLFSRRVAEAYPHRRRAGEVSGIFA